LYVNKMKRSIWFILLAVILVFPVFSQQNGLSLSLPPGFKWEIYAEGITSARGMAVAPDGTLFTGSKKGNVYRIDPSGKVEVIADNLSMPVGVEYFEGDLYISEISKIQRIKKVLSAESEKYPLETIIEGLPRDRWHGWKFIKIGPDRKLYVPVGAPCNVCLKNNPQYASILSFDLTAGDYEIFAHGVRNTVGFDWHPQSEELYFTDNGRDNMGDNIPPDELNYAPRKGLHFGFPFLHGKDIEDPKYWGQRDRDDFNPPLAELPAHVAALGMRFYTGTMFPKEYQGGIFIAEHGSWNRSEKIGYRISFISLAGENPEYKIFAAGWLQGKDYVLGRPADVEIGVDGSLFVSDDYGSRIFRIWYEG